MCQKCRGIAMRKEPDRVQRNTPCIDCGEPTRGTRCNPCWGIATRGANSPVWKGGARAKKARTYAKHREKNIAYSRAYYAANRDMILEKIRADLSFKSRNAYGRRSAKPGAIVELVDFTAIFAAQRGLCGICGEYVQPEDVSFDHRIPLARGGDHTAANLQLTHLLCNARKAVQDRMS